MLQHLDVEIPFKVSVGFVVLLQKLDMEIPFKVSVGSVVLLQHLDMEVPFKVSVGSVVLWQHLDTEVPFKVSVGSVFLLQHLGSPHPYKCRKGGGGTKLQNIFFCIFRVVCFSIWVGGGGGREGENCRHALCGRIRHAGNVCCNSSPALSRRIFGLRAKPYNPITLNPKPPSCLLL